MPLQVRDRSTARSAQDFAPDMARVHDARAAAALLFQSGRKSPGLLTSMAQRVAGFFAGRAGARDALTRNAPGAAQGATRHIAAASVPIRHSAAASAPTRHAAAASAAPVRSTAPAADPLGRAIAEFKARFPAGPPAIDQVLANRATDPVAFALCRQVVAGTQYAVALDCMAALDDLRAAPSLDSARALRERFIQDPRNDDVMGGGADGKLNLYAQSYKGFEAAFASAEAALASPVDAAASEAGMRQLTAAFDEWIRPTVAMDVRQFRQNVEGVIRQHTELRPPGLPLRPTIDMFA